MAERRSGILLHITSLPSRFGIGDLGPAAYAFADFLERAGQRLWQVLPLNPTEPAYGNSPYHSISSFAFNPVLASPEALVREGLIDAEDLPLREAFPPGRAAYRAAAEARDRLFSIAYERFRSRGGDGDYEAFCEEHAHWLEDFALFAALRERFQGRPWPSWPPGLRDRDPAALDPARRELGEEMDRIRFVQYLLHRQWRDLRSFCRDRGVSLVGDMPIYVVLDSADVWVAPHCFKLNDQKQPTAVAGVPPDYFSETGQLWGNPVYRWDVLKAQEYDWWIRRIRHNLTLYDRVRVDHFRGFVGYWEVPAGEKNATNGRWVDAPAVDFFESVLREIPGAPIIAEDLGVITADVREIMDRFGFPGMKVLVFAFGPELPSNPYAPHNHEKHCVVYTGTHDNNTARGWFEEEATEEDRARLASYVGHPVTPETVHRDLMRLAMASVGDTAVLSMPDVLGLSGAHRMNTPATRNGNWTWRMSSGAADEELARGLREMSELYGRARP
ncbi:MAG: 4-alpha-glucanotransferase [Deltaproteobacteria bacterium]|nr:4-alpha-glucanotransferase [Deltaproteobacteria bacterium]